MSLSRALQRRLGFTLLVLGPLLFLPSQVARAKDPSVFGYWKSIDKDSGNTQSIFRIWKHEDKLIGKIVKVFLKPGEKGPRICGECNGAQKNKPIEGLIFMWDFAREDGREAKWVDGKILNPQDGRTYHGEVTLSKDGKTLTVYGYIRVLVKLGGSDVWQRPSEAELQTVPRS